MNMNEYLTAEQDKWHRRYNDAEIEIDRLKRENERLELAIHRLIMERDCAIKDITNGFDDLCEVCKHKDECDVDCDYGHDDFECEWRGVKR